MSLPFVLGLSIKRGRRLRVEIVGNKIILITTTLQKIEETDNPFRDSGKIGLWTKADSVSYFDDLHVTAR